MTVTVTVTVTEADFIRDVTDAVVQFGGRPRTIAPLHPLTRLRRKCASFRVDIEPEMVIKARRMENEAAARRQQALRADLPAAFAPVLSRVGNVLLERWIEGRPLDQVSPGEALIRKAGEVLAALHAVRRAAGTSLPFRGEVAGLRNEIISRLRLLAACGAMAPPLADRLCRMAEETAPSHSRHCLIHTDFCEENLVVDAAGDLFVVDNEHFRFGPPGMDLARSWYRCGWQDRSWQWQTFRDAYEAASGGDPEPSAHQTFWRIAAVTFSASLRVATGDPDVPLNCLRTLVENE